MNTIKNANIKTQKNKKSKDFDTKNSESRDFREEILENSLMVAAATLKIDALSLVGWLKQHQPISPVAKYNLLRVISEYELNPFNEEVILLDSNQLDQSRWPFITVDGWIKLINQHPQFCGIEFRQPDRDEGQRLEWMECTIYRKDRIRPITVREYLSEVVTDQEIWKDRPKRMLRHRAMAQCAKLAFGICISDYTLRSKPENTCKKPDGSQPNFKIVNPDRMNLVKEILISRQNSAL